MADRGHTGAAYRLRSSSAYRNLRAWVIRTHPPVCRVCKRFVDVSLPGKHPMGPSLGHVRALVDGGDELDPENAGLEHTGCNSGKENRRRAQRRREQLATPRASRAW